MMITDDLNINIDKILEKAKNNLIHYGADLIKKEHIKMRICYPNFTTDDYGPSVIKREIFLFNKSNDKVAHVLCRNKISDDDFDIVEF